MGSASGSAYVFERSAEGTWTETAKLVASDGPMNDEMGRSVAVSEGVVLGGAMYEDGDGVDTGSAYVFDVGMPQLGCEADVTPMALDYGTIEVGETATLATTLSNEGDGASDVTANVDSSTGEFALNSASSFTVAAGEAAHVLVDYAPLDIGDDPRQVTT
jgi:hypothetical protein